MNKKDFITLDDLNRVVNQCFGEAKREIKTLQSRVADLQEQVKEQERRIKFLEEKQTPTIISTSILSKKEHFYDDQDQKSELKAGESLNIIKSEAISCTTRIDVLALKEHSDWMNSTQRSRSLWARKEYRITLLNYIGSVYGQEKAHIIDIHNTLNLESDPTPDLDQLHQVIKVFEQQPGAKESLQEWQTDNRPSKRVEELASFFRNDCLRNSKLLWLSHHKNGIDKTSIKAYFDLICRNGLVTTQIGRFFGLERSQIFGGDEENICDNNVTYTKIDLNGRSKIHLDDQRVDLITCLVTLHHVSHLESMVEELTRILRPGGYLIIREHDCKKERSHRVKYLNFLHGFMMIAEVGEFAAREGAETQGNSSRKAWAEQKQALLEYTHSIDYRTREEWRKELGKGGFVLIGTLDYDETKISNQQALYYDAFQLKRK